MKGEGNWQRQSVELVERCVVKEMVGVEMCVDVWGSCQ